MADKKEQQIEIAAVPQEPDAVEETPSAFAVHSQPGIKKSKPPRSAP
jgi:hypothetical protein